MWQQALTSLIALHASPTLGTLGTLGPAPVAVRIEPGAPAATLEAQLADALLASGLSTVDRAALNLIADTGRASATSTLTAGAEEALRRGREAYDALDLARAVEVLSRSASHLEGNIASLDHLAPLVQTKLQLGLALLAMGKRAESHQALLGMFVWEPDFTLDRRYYPPEQVAAVARAARAARAALPAALTLSAGPADAALFLDGRSVGTGSAWLRDLRPGRHALRAERRGFWPDRRGVTLSPGDARSVTLSPAENRTKAASEALAAILVSGADRDADLRSATLALVEAARLGSAVVGSLRQDALTLHHVGPRSARTIVAPWPGRGIARVLEDLVRSQPISPAAAANPREQAPSLDAPSSQPPGLSVQAPTSPTAVAPPAVAAAAAAPREGRSLSWLWLLLGLLAAGGAGAAFLGLRGRGMQRTDPELVVQVDGIK